MAVLVLRQDFQHMRVVVPAIFLQFLMTAWALEMG